MSLASYISDTKNIVTRVMKSDNRHPKCANVNKPLSASLSLERKPNTKLYEDKYSQLR